MNLHFKRIVSKGIINGSALVVGELGATAAKSVLALFMHHACAIHIWFLLISDVFRLRRWFALDFHLLHAGPKPQPVRPLTLVRGKLDRFNNLLMSRVVILNQSRILGRLEGIERLSV